MAENKEAKESKPTESSPPREIPPPTYNWMGISHQWNTRARPGRKGLTIADLNVGIYGEVPDHWDDQSRMPRGAVARPGSVPIGYSMVDKWQLWADCAADLYEEAIQRRWIPATDVPWDTVEQLPRDVETAMCQLCTELSQQANVEIEAVSSWQHQMSYGYHEVKLFLASETFDAGRHHEAFRKRALINGGGLGLESKGDVNRMILETRGGWTEAVAYLYLMRGTLTQTVYRYLEQYAHNDAERVIFSRAMQDKARHLTYGLEHLRYAVTHRADKAAVLQQVLTIGELIFARELHDPVFKESLAIIFGNGVEGARRHGMRKTEELLRRWVDTYLDYCDWIGVPRRERLMPQLSMHLGKEAAAAAAARSAAQQGDVPARIG